MTALDGLTLAVDAAWSTGTVALLRDGAVVAQDAVAMRNRDEERLLPAVLAVLRGAEVPPAALARVVCGAGPGSFTSLRIAASIAKGMATAGGATLCAVPSLALVVAAAEPPLPTGRYLVLLDAMRGERYALAVVVAEDGRIGADEEHRLLPLEAALALARSEGATIIGPADGMGLAPHARGVARLAPLVEAVALDGWEPDYGRLAEAQVQWERRHGRALPQG